MTSKISAALCVGATLVILAFAASPAVASSRVFLREIKETTPGSALNPAGIAVQERNKLGEEKNNLWVENRQLSQKNSSENVETLAEFGPVSSANAFIEALPAKSSLEGPDSLEHLAVEDDSEDFYVVGSTRKNGGSQGPVVVYNHKGEEPRVWEKSPGEPLRFAEGTVTVDNAPLSLEDPSGCALGGECSVYVTETGAEGGIMRFDSAGHPVPFTYDAECEKEHCEYVSGNKITGVPGRPKPYEAFLGGLKRGLAVDARGDIYAISNGPFAVYEYAPSGRFLRSFDLTSPEVPLVHEHVNDPASVAVDPVTGHLLVGIGGVVIENTKYVGAIDEFETEGARAGKFVAQITAKSGGEALGSVEALSVDSKGDVYGVEEHVIGERPEHGGLITQSDVVVYGPDVFPPVLTLAAATQRTPTGAQLNGTVNPNGFKLTECEFQDVPQKQFEEEKGDFKGVTPQETAACVPAAASIPNEGTTPATAQVAGLTPGETYHYRLLAHSEEPRDGVAETGSLAFTAPAAPGIVATSAANISSTFADLHAQIAPHGAETSYHFEYDTRPYGEGEGPHGTSVPIPDESVGLGGPTGGAVESVVRHVGPLAPASTYYYRIVAGNAQGVTSGGVCEGQAGLRADCAFATLPAAVGAAGRPRV